MVFIIKTWLFSVFFTEDLFACVDFLTCSHCDWSLWADVHALTLPCLSSRALEGSQENMSMLRVWNTLEEDIWSSWTCPLFMPMGSEHPSQNRCECQSHTSVFDRNINRKHTDTQTHTHTCELTSQQLQTQCAVFSTDLWVNSNVLSFNGWTKGAGGGAAVICVSTEYLLTNTNMKTLKQQIKKMLVKLITKITSSSFYEVYLF